MASNVKELCRLCAKKDEFSKDLLDDGNKSVLKLVQDFIQLAVNKDDYLPTKICLNCEEKMISFQLFILECYKTQDNLRKLYLEKYENDTQIKVEDGLQFDADGIISINSSLIKSEYIGRLEVKDELTAEEIVGSLNDKNTAELDKSEHSDYDNNDDNGNDDYEDDDDEYDDITIASLKEMKEKQIKKRVLTEEEAVEFSKILSRPTLKVRDFVKLICSICNEASKTWNALRSHSSKKHKSTPIVYCLCGFVIRSKSVLYKHVSDHRMESRKLRNATESESEKQEDANYKTVNVKDYIDFTCNHCEKVCSSWYSLKSHSERCHKIAPIVKCICGITLKSKSVLYKHVQDHRNPNVLSCDKCPRITKTLSALNKHKMRHIPKSERKFCCASCDKIFTSKDALKSHQKSHIPIEERKIYHCDQCNMKFTTRSSAASHKRVVHEKIKSYVCDLCGYACGTNGELRQHRAIHSDDKPFVCKKCSKPFKTYSNLKTHMDTHEDTSYTCYVCCRVLNSRRTLRKHLLVHEDKCRHVCSYCNKAFKRRQTLKVHMYTHTGDKPLTCKWCDERFAYASTLRSHRLRCHPDKMAAQAHNTYANYAHATMQEEYLKNDVAAKNEVEAM